jgi:hypothetical protein
MPPGQRHAWKRARDISRDGAGGMLLARGGSVGAVNREVGGIILAGPTKYGRQISLEGGRAAIHQGAAGSELAGTSRGGAGAGA